MHPIEKEVLVIYTLPKLDANLQNPVQLRKRLFLVFKLFNFAP